MNLNVILTGNLPLERERKEKTAKETEQVKGSEIKLGREGERKRERGLNTPVRFTALNYLKHLMVTTG